MSTHYNNWGIRVNEQRYYRQAKKFYNIIKYNKEGEISVAGDTFRVVKNNVDITVNGWSHHFPNVSKGDKLFLFDKFLTAYTIEGIVREWNELKGLENKYVETPMKTGKIAPVIRR